jgi:hypothetical protein
MVKTRRVRRKNRKTRRQRGGAWLNKWLGTELTNDKVKSLLDGTEILPKSNQLIDQFFADYVNGIFPGNIFDRFTPELKQEYETSTVEMSQRMIPKPLIDFINDGSKVERFLGPHVVFRFLFKFKEGIDKNKRLIKTKAKFDHLIYFRYKYLEGENIVRGNEKEKEDIVMDNEVAYLSKQLLRQFNQYYPFKPIKAAMVNIRKAIDAEKATSTPVPAQPV